MKKFTKVCLIISLCFGLGAVLFLSIGAVMGSGYTELKAMLKSGQLHLGPWYVSDFSVTYGKAASDYDTQEMRFSAEEIQQLDIELKYGTLYLEASEESDTITVSVSGYTEAVTVSQEEHTLKISDERSHIKWKNENQVEIVVSIPAGKEFELADIEAAAGEVSMDSGLAAKVMEIELDAGALYAAELIAEDELKLTVGAGEIDVDTLEAEKLDAEVGAGRLWVEELRSSDIKAQCGMGEIYFYLTDATEDDYNYSIQCGIGTIDLGGSSYSSLGQQKKISNGVSDSMDIECGVGNVEIEFGR